MTAIALTIAGLDPSGGAGIAADLKTFHQHGVYGCAVASVLTVQNTRALARVEPVAADLVRAQIDCLLDDIRPGAIKTGALGSSENVAAIAERLRGAGIPLVVDPVRIAKHGAALLADTARSALLDRLLPIASLLTANADEAEWLSECTVRDEAGARAAGERLAKLGARAVLVKGGHLDGDDAADLLWLDGVVHRLNAPRLRARHTHGVGCTLSAAICANLALGCSLLEACRRAKRWLSAAIASAPGVGHGIGSVDHFAPLAAVGHPVSRAEFQVAALDHVQLAIPIGAEAEAERFYAGLLGLARVPKPEPLASRGGCWFASGKVQLHLGVEAEFRAAKKAHPALVIAGFDALLAKLEAHGIAFRADTELPDVRRGFIEDPFGNRIELIAG